MEEKIYERQVIKQSISHRVVDEKQIARHYTANELQELYKFEPDKVYDDLPTNTQVSIKLTIWYFVWNEPIETICW